VRGCGGKEPSLRCEILRLRFGGLGGAHRLLRWFVVGQGHGHADVLFVAYDVAHETTLACGDSGLHRIDLAVVVSSHLLIVRGGLNSIVLTLFTLFR